MSMNAELLQQFSKSVSDGIVAGLSQVGYGQKAPVGTPATTGWTHGVGGIFGVPGLDQDVVSARIIPQGISSVLRVLPSLDAFPMFPYITGVEEEGDDEPSTVCATCPSGVTEGCIQSACFGRICRETRELTVSRAIERINRGDLDMRLLNDMLGLDMRDPWMVARNLNRNTVLQIATLQAMMEVAILLQNALIPMVWTGNPANNVGTGYQEFNGLDTLISTGKVDFLTSTTCPALDSDVKDFNYGQINAVDANGNFTLVRNLEYLEAFVHRNARRMRLLPVEWVWCMREELWYELTNFWPIAYLTTRNFVVPARHSMDIDATRVRDMIDDMRRRQVLWVNGREHPVVLDDGIFESNSTNDANVPAGSFASNIYLVPITFLGGRPGTYLQYKDYRGGSAPAEIALSRSEDFYWTDAGRFMWTVERLKWCYTLSAQVEPRIILHVPQLAGRLDNVMYTPLQRFRDPFQDSDYFYKGGVESRAFPFGTVYPEHARAEGVTPTDGHCQE